MIGKFENEQTAYLYAQEPDDSIGHSLDGGCWYGLYRGTRDDRGNHLAGSIVVEDTFGFVGRSDFRDGLTLELTWCEIGIGLESVGMDVYA